MAQFLLSPTFLALVASVLFGVMVVMAKLGLRHMDAFTAARFSIGVTLLFFIVLALFSLRLSDFLSPWVLLFVALGFFQPFLSMFLSFEATQRLGPTVSATVSSPSPLFAMAGAVLLLGEALTPPIFLGTLGVVMGVMVLSWQGKARRDWQAVALLFAIATAMIRGFGNLGQKFGMEMVPLPVLAGLVTYTVSFSLGLLVHLLNPYRRPLRIPWAGAKWLVVAGVGNGIAMWCMIAALRGGMVVVVVPIIGSFPLFTLLASVLWFRQERLTWRIIAGMLLILPSVAAISLYR
jgi:drug/metabolite transporter (DMT)-like permease